MAEAMTTSAGGTERLFEAIKAGDLVEVEALIERDPTLVDARGPGGVPAVILAAYHGRATIADLLVERGAELDIFAAALRGDLPLTELLLARGADPTVAADD